jgi:UDP-N-acetylglucosamine diphosphorylase / glucose-1-phosphate thymidylyltransferase / UDP-N-acetylgalactosamine diphosphorylase / glucosamine-1-phosphate N-acetyltransferase / galactosamine-1-phosphate N-acetyltransferase
MSELLRVSNLLDLEKTEFAEIFDGVEYPWEILQTIVEFIRKTAPSLSNHYKMIRKDVWVGEGTIIADTAFIEGPVIIGCNSEIRHNAFIRGKAVIGDNCVIGNATEVKNSFLFNNVQAPHFNYVGDSVMGYKSHIGAGVILSNVKSIPGNVTIRTAGKIIETGLRKFSAVLGDYTEVGCNSVLNPGTILGRKTIVYPLTSARGFIPENHILKNDGTIRKMSI